MARVKIINGDLAGPTVQPKHWNYRPFQRREYGDGLVILVEATENGINGRPLPDGPRVRATVWIQADGLNGGSASSVITCPSDIGGLLVRYRNGLRKLGLYGEHGVYRADGTRRKLNDPSKSS